MTHTYNEHGDIIGSYEHKKGQRLLFVHQTAYQRCILDLFGRLCLLDATYKTTKFAIPLIFLVVKTNVGYQVVASFAIQDETTAAITEALEIIKSWCPDWNPNVFFLDNCEEEIQALEFTFKGKLFRFVLDYILLFYYTILLSGMSTI